LQTAPRAETRLTMTKFACPSLHAAAVLLLAGCALAPPHPPSTTFAVVADAPFALDGRLAARRGSDAVTANFTWHHAPPRDDLVVTTPVGQSIAELSGDTDAQRVEMRMADGRRADGPDWMSLTERALGFPLPIAGLAAWVRGGPHPATPHWVEPDAAGRAAVLRQDGWEIVYGYHDGATRAPSRLRLAHTDVEVRIVIDRWNP
jgi:outer membrane lipoprotein LolB